MPPSCTTRPEPVGAKSFPGKANLAELPPEIISEIFSYLSVGQIPSMRLISRYFALRLFDLLQWRQRAVSFSKKSKTLVSEYCDLNTISLAELKQIVIRTDNLELAWRELNPRCMKPWSTWRHPDPGERVTFSYGFFRVDGLYSIRTTNHAHELWDIRKNKLMFRMDGFGALSFFVLDSSSRFLQGFSYDFDITSLRIQLSFYNVSFPAPGDSESLLTATKRQECLVSGLRPARWQNFFPTIIDLEEQSFAFLSWAQNGTFHLCLVFGAVSRYCVIDSGLTNDEGTAAFLDTFDDKDEIVLHICSSHLHTQRTWNLQQLLECSENLDALSTISLSGVVGNASLLTPVSSMQAWGECCSVALGRELFFFNDAYFPTGAGLSAGWRRLSFVGLYKTDETSASDPQHHVDVFWIVQFYCSDRGPISKHRLVFKLTNPYLRPNTVMPLYSSDFSRFFWVEQLDNGAQLVLRMLEFPFSNTSSADEVCDDARIHEEEPVVSTLDIPGHILRNSEGFKIERNHGSIYVCTNDGDVHEFRYS